VNRTDDDRADGSRVRLPGWSLTEQTLADGAATDAIVVPPLPDDVSPRFPLLAVFKGRLGHAPDSEEPEAVAAAPVGLGAFQVATGSSTDTSAGPSDFGDIRFLDP